MQGKDEANHVWAPAAALVLAGAAVYANSLGAAFVFDDLPSIVGNPSIRTLWPVSEPLFSATYATVIGRPLLNCSLAVNYAIGGVDVLGYRLFNVVVHILAGLTLFGLLRRSARSPAVSSPSRGAALGAAFPAALLWTVHPLQTESVTYVVQRAESLAGLFYLAALYGLARSATAKRPGRWWAASIAAGLLGVCTKETVATLPLVALFYDRVFWSADFKEVWRRRRGLHLGLLAAWLPLAALMISSAGRAATAGFGYGLGGWPYARAQFGFVLRYLRLCFWPHPLILDYGAEWAGSSLEVALSAVGVAVLLAAALVALRWRPPLGFLGIAFFLILAPTSGLAPLVTQIGAEHRLYLPLAAVVILTVTGVRWLCSTLPRRTGRIAPVALTALATLALGALTAARNADYRSAVSIWSDTVQKRPDNARAHLNLGAALAEAGNLRGALLHFARAVDLRPDDPEALYNRANARAALGRPAAALADYDRALALRPSFAEAYSNRGDLRRMLRQYGEAVADYTHALALDPNLAPAYAGRALAHLERGDYAAARTDAAACRERGGALPPGLVRALARPGSANP